MPQGIIPFPFGQCHICQDKASGVHYGVPTCEGCKGFYKRSIPKGDKYRCYFGGKCTINPENRNRCKACRFKKCLQQGMAFDAVKMGRIPKVEKDKALEQANTVSSKTNHALHSTSKPASLPLMTPADLLTSTSADLISTSTGIVSSIRRQASESLSLGDGGMMDWDIAQPGPSQSDSGFSLDCQKLAPEGFLKRDSLKEPALSSQCASSETGSVTMQGPTSTVLDLNLGPVDFQSNSSSANKFDANDGSMNSQSRVSVDSFGGNVGSANNHPNTSANSCSATLESVVFQPNSTATSQAIDTGSSFSSNFGSANFQPTPSLNSLGSNPLFATLHPVLKHSISMHGSQSSCDKTLHGLNTARGIQRGQSFPGSIPNSAGDSLLNDGSMGVDSGSALCMNANEVLRRQSDVAGSSFQFQDKEVCIVDEPSTSLPFGREEDKLRYPVETERPFVPNDKSSVDVPLGPGKPGISFGHDKPSVRVPSGHDKAHVLFGSNNSNVSFGHDKPSVGVPFGHDKSSISVPFGHDKPRVSFSYDKSSVSFDHDKPSESFGHDTTSVSFGHDKPSVSFSHDKPSVSFGHDKPSVSFGHDNSSVSFGHDKPSVSFGHDKPSVSFGHDKPNVSFGHDKPIGTFGHDDSSANVPSRNDPSTISVGHEKPNVSHGHSKISFRVQHNLDKSKVSLENNFDTPSTDRNNTDQEKRLCFPGDIHVNTADTNLSGNSGDNVQILSDKSSVSEQRDPAKLKSSHEQVAQDFKGQVGIQRSYEGMLESSGSSCSNNGVGNSCDGAGGSRGFGVGAGPGGSCGSGSGSGGFSVGTGCVGSCGSGSGGGFSVGAGAGNCGSGGGFSAGVGGGGGSCGSGSANGGFSVGGGGGNCGSGSDGGFSVGAGSCGCGSGNGDFSVGIGGGSCGRGGGGGNGDGDSQSFSPAMIKLLIQQVIQGGDKDRTDKLAKRLSESFPPGCHSVAPLHPVTVSSASSTQPSHDLNISASSLAVNKVSNPFTSLPNCALDGSQAADISISLTSRGFENSQPVYASTPLTRHGIEGSIPVDTTSLTRHGIQGSNLVDTTSLTRHGIEGSKPVDTSTSVTHLALEGSQPVDISTSLTHHGIEGSLHLADSSTPLTRRSLESSQPVCSTTMCSPNVSFYASLFTNIDSPSVNSGKASLQNQGSTSLTHNRILAKDTFSVSQIYSNTSSSFYSGSSAPSSQDFTKQQQELHAQSLFVGGVPERRCEVKKDSSRQTHHLSQVFSSPESICLPGSALHSAVQPFNQAEQVRREGSMPYATPASQENPSSQPQNVPMTLTTPSVDKTFSKIQHVRGVASMTHSTTSVFQEKLFGHVERMEPSAFPIPSVSRESFFGQSLHEGAPKAMVYTTPSLERSFNQLQNVRGPESMTNISLSVSQASSSSFSEEFLSSLQSNTGRSNQGTGSIMGHALPLQYSQSSATLPQHSLFTGTSLQLDCANRDVIPASHVRDLFNTDVSSMSELFRSNVLSPASGVKESFNSNVVLATTDVRKMFTANALPSGSNIRDLIGRNIVPSASAVTETIINVPSASDMRESFSTDVLSSISNVRNSLSSTILPSASDGRQPSNVLSASEVREMLSTSLSSAPINMEDSVSRNNPSSLFARETFSTNIREMSNSNIIPSSSFARQTFNSNVQSTSNKINRNTIPSTSFGRETLNNNVQSASNIRETSNSNIIPSSSFTRETLNSNVQSASNIRETSNSNNIPSFSFTRETFNSNIHSASNTINSNFIPSTSFVPETPSSLHISPGRGTPSTFDLDLCTLDYLCQDQVRDQHELSSISTTNSPAPTSDSCKVTLDPDFLPEAEMKEAVAVLDTSIYDIFELAMRRPLRDKYVKIKREDPTADVPPSVATHLDMYPLLMEAMGGINRKIIKFCQVAPGFAKLDPADQQILLKRAYYDIWMLVSSEFFVDGESYLWTKPDVFYVRRHMEKIIGAAHTHTFHKFARQFNLLGLSHLEVAIICCIQLTAPSHDQHTDLKDVKEIQKLNSFYLDLLVAVVSLIHPDTCSRVLVDIFRLVPLLGEVNRLQRELIGRFSVKRPPSNPDDVPEKT